MTVICPNCGYHNDEKPYAPELLHLIFDLPLKQKDVLVRLMDARGGLVSRGQLIDHIYVAHPDGGPDTAINSLQTHICKLRPHIRPLGWDIINDRASGYRLARIAI